MGTDPIISPPVGCLQQSNLSFINSRTLVYCGINPELAYNITPKTELPRGAGGIPAVSKPP